MDTSNWLPVKRADGETVGYLEPLVASYDRVCPRSVLGHPVMDSCDYFQGEELLTERGIGELMNHWMLRNAASDRHGPLSILEVSPAGIVVADALLTKALMPTERIHLAWPDVDAALVPYPLD
ncbi:hypothetical protein ACT3UQ_10100 [Glutamicibacter sp. AOP12-B1-11]|uniref:hypothetical protein n=1 Tax=Micrococcaceae TaxID=1268 RepID=UPI0011AFE71F|nr:MULTISPECIES: hypothetical protein [unclassified Arthrobacter]